MKMVQINRINGMAGPGFGARVPCVTEGAEKHPIAKNIR
jgi:hypothetical protein